MPPKKNKLSQKKTPQKPTKVYKVHEVQFAGKPALIVCSSKADDVLPCPFLGLCNLLLLRNAGSGTVVLDTDKMSDGTRSVTPKKLQAFVFNLLARSVKAGTMADKDRDQHLKGYQAQLDDLRSQTGVFPMHSKTDEFTITTGTRMSESLFHPLGVTQRHALIPDPEDTRLCSVTKDVSYFQLILEFQAYEVDCKSGKHYDESKHDKMRVVKEFLIEGPEFTKCGLGLLREEATENELFLFHLHGDFHVVYMKDGEFYFLATEEDMRSKYPDIMWIGLDENFNIGNPAETKRKLTSSFSPVNENWSSISNQFLEELEEEKRRSERKIKTIVSQKEAPATCLPTKEDTYGKVKTVQESCDNAKGAEMKQSEIVVAEMKQSVQESCDNAKGAETKQSEIVVARRFLRFMHRRIVTFKEFASSCSMYKIYHYKLQKFSSTSYAGRLLAKGFLVFIFKVHKSGYSWNGDFKEEDMFVELELVDGVSVGGINFFITLPPFKGFNKDHGKADLRTFVRILFPLYLPNKDFQQLPYYFVRFEGDIGEMPDFDSPEKLEKFHMYMSDHFFAKAPLARSTLVSSVYGLCDSEIFHADKNKPKPRYCLLDVEVPAAKNCISQWITQLSDPLNKIYLRSRVETHFTESNRWTFWDAIELGRHSKQHMMDNTQVNGVQQIQDPIIIDLIVEQDLRGILTDAIKFMIQKTNFKGRFESTWEQFSGSEPKDGGARIPFLSGDTDVHVAVEPEAPAMPVAETVAETEAAPIQVAGRFIESDYGIKLTEEGLRSLEGEKWVFDEVIDFVYSEFSSQFMSKQDILFVQPSIAHLMTNLPADSNPLRTLDPGNNNLLLFPVNNSEEHERGDGGTHWSLVVLRVDRSHNQCRFVHHDSIVNMNRGAAERLFGNLKQLFSSFHSTFIEGQTPQQANGYDCGVYVIALSYKIACWWKNVKSGQKADTDWFDAVSKVNSKMVSDRRRQMFEKLKMRFDY